MRNLLIIIIFAISTNVLASDTEKVAAAKRYLAVTPMSDMFNDMAAKMAEQLPRENRTTFIKVMTEEVDIKLLELAALDAMVKTFSTEELDSFTEFYGSKLGRSATSKLGTYMSFLMPVIQKEVERAFEKVEGIK